MRRRLGQIVETSLISRVLFEQIIGRSESRRAISNRISSNSSIIITMLLVKTEHTLIQQVEHRLLMQAEKALAHRHRYEPRIEELLGFRGRLHLDMMGLIARRRRVVMRVVVMAWWARVYFTGHVYRWLVDDCCGRRCWAEHRCRVVVEWVRFGKRYCDELGWGITLVEFGYVLVVCWWRDHRFGIFRLLLNWIFRYRLFRNSLLEMMFFGIELIIEFF